MICPYVIQVVPGGYRVWNFVEWKPATSVGDFEKVMADFELLVFSWFWVPANDS